MLMYGDPVGVITLRSVNGRWPRPASTTWVDTAGFRASGANAHVGRPHGRDDAALGERQVAQARLHYLG